MTLSVRARRAFECIIVYFHVGLPFPAHFTRDPAVVQALLNDQFDNFEKGEPFRTRLRELLGTGIFNADGDRE
jgi:hypothetical protein